MIPIHLRPTKCPYCNRENPLVSDGYSAATPHEGDVSICWTCGDVAIFDNKHPGGLRVPNERERAEIAADDDIQSALFARLVSLKAIP